MELNREKLKRMFEDTKGNGGSTNGGGGGGSLAGYATQAWVNEGFVSIDFFNRLFTVYGPGETSSDPDVVIEPNDLDSTIKNIKAMFGLWTEQYLSALGLNPGGTGSATSLNMLDDVNITTPTNGQALVYNSTSLKWENQTIATVTALANLTDVLLTSPDNNQFLMYDGSSSKWVNIALKTINSQSLIGSGDISVGGGASGNYLPLTGGTVTGRTVFSKRGDAGGYSDNGAALIIGGTINQSHIEIDDNEIIAKASASSPSHLYLNWDSGNIMMCNLGVVTIGSESMFDYKLNVNGTAGFNGNVHVKDVRYNGPNKYGMMVLFPTDWGGVNSNEFGIGSDNYNSIIRCYDEAYIYYGSTSLRNRIITSKGGTFDGRVVINLDNDAEATNPNSGSLCIGTSSGNHLLLDGNEIIAASGSSTSTLYIQYNGGNIKIGGEGSVSVSITGSLYATGSITALSDIRFKNIINQEAYLGFDDVANAPIIKFTWKEQTADNKGLHVGSIAQYWEKVLPEAVKRDKEGTLSMSYGVVALVAAISTAKKVRELDERVTKLEKIER